MDIVQRDRKDPSVIRVVYFGTPEYAVPALVALAGDDQYQIRLVVTQPDRPAGRGHALLQPAVKRMALELGLPVYQPESLRTESLRMPLAEACADVFVVAAYGLIFGPRTLAIPRRGCVNLHASLLPRYRGASPISAAILAGDDETGVSLMLMNRGMDTGPVLAMRRTKIEECDTTGSLTSKLADDGAKLLTQVLPEWVSGTIEPVEQSNRGASAVRPMVKADGWIDWTDSAVRIDRQCRAMKPWPKCWTTLPDGRVMQIAEARRIDGKSGAPGEVLVDNKLVIVHSGSGSVVLSRVQVAGSSEVDAISLINGRKLKQGDVLGKVGRPETPSALIQILD